MRVVLKHFHPFRHQTFSILKHNHNFTREEKVERFWILEPFLQHSKVQLEIEAWNSNTKDKTISCVAYGQQSVELEAH